METAATRLSAIVSGSATGIGAATAEALARHGIDVTVNYHRSAGAAEATAARCRQSGAHAIAVQGDISDDAACPGFVDTNWMSAKLGDEDLAAFKEKVSKLAPLRRLVSAEEVAESVCWFALGGRSITGQLLVIDGGTHLTVGSPL